MYKFCMCSDCFLAGAMKRTVSSEDALLEGQDSSYKTACIFAASVRRRKPAEDMPGHSAKSSMIEAAMMVAF